MKDLILTRSVAIKTWNVKATVCFAQKRSEYLSILKHIQTNNGATARDYAKYVLLEEHARTAVAERLFANCALYGLLRPTQNKHEFELTELGLSALQSEQIFVPQEGMWTIWATQDALFSQGIFAAKPFEEPLGGKDKKDARKFENLPLWLKSHTSKVLNNLADKKTFMVKDLDARVEANDSSRSVLTLTWNISRKTLRLTGKLDGHPIDHDLDAPLVAQDTLWLELLEQIGSRQAWDQNIKSLLVGFDQNLSELERRKMQMSVHFQRPNIKGFSQFDSMVVEDISIYPKTSGDAKQWAEWRLIDNISDYATTAKFEDWSSQACAPFTAFEVQLPSRSTLNNALKQPRYSGLEAKQIKAWYLTAALDWNI